MKPTQEQKVRLLKGDSSVLQELTKKQREKLLREELDIAKGYALYLLKTMDTPEKQENLVGYLKNLKVIDSLVESKQKIITKGLKKKFNKAFFCFNYLDPFNNKNNNEESLVYLRFFLVP